MEKLISLLKKRKKYSIQLNMLIGKELATFITDPTKTVSTILEITTQLSKASVYVYPSFLLDCYVGYSNLKHFHADMINTATWQNAISHITDYLTTPEEAERFIEIEMEMLELLGEKNESRIERLREVVSSLNKSKNAEFVIAHTADLHFEDDDLLEETKKSAEFIIKTLKEIKPNLTVIAGDIIHSRQEHDSPALLEAALFVKRLAELSPVFMIPGTRSHDGNNLEIFQQIRTDHELYVSSVAEYVGFSNGHFVRKPESPEIQELLILSLPLTMGSTKKDSVASILKKFQSIRKPPKSILVSHGTVKGIKAGSGYLLTEVDYTAEELKETGVNLCLLGHIHKAQKVDNIYYSGSIIRRNADESEEKGFWVHYLENEKSRFITIPTRQIHRIEISSPEDIKLFKKINPAEGDALKVVVKLKEGQVIKNLEYEIQKEFERFNGVKITIEKTIIPEHKVRIKGISKIPSLEEKCIKTAEILGIPVTDTLIEKIRLARIHPDDEKERYKEELFIGEKP